MKTIITLCLSSVLSLICHLNSSAQNSTAPFTASSTSSVTAVKIINFNGSISNEKVLLNWSVEANQDVNQFVVEKSTDGTDFVMAAIVFGTDKKSTDNYMFYEKAKNTSTSYRVKVILNNGTFSYSQVITPASSNTNK